MADTPIPQPILVGIDGSRESVEALRYAGRLGDALGLPIEALTVWDYPAVADYYILSDWSPEDDARSVIADAIRSAFGDSPPEGLTTSVADGHPARTLIERSRHCEMLLLGSRGHGGFVGLLLGSVSTACAGHAHCPVLIVPTEKASAERSVSSTRRDR